MAGKRDIAWVADTIVTQLKAKLPAKLNTLDTEYGDGITLEDIPDTNYFISEVEKLPGFPLLAVVPERSELPADGRDRYGMEIHYLTLALALIGNEGEDLLTRRTLRTVRGIEAVFLDDTTLACSVDDIRVSDKVFSPLLSGEDALLKEAQVNVVVMTTNP